MKNMEIFISKINKNIKCKMYIQVYVPLDHKNISMLKMCQKQSINCVYCTQPFLLMWTKLINLETTTVLYSSNLLIELYLLIDQK